MLKEIIEQLYLFAFILLFDPKVLMSFDLKGIYKWESKCFESVFN